MNFKLTIKELKEELSKFDDNANAVIVFKNCKNQLVFTDDLEVYNRTQLKDEKLIKDKNLVFIDITND